MILPIHRPESARDYLLESIRSSYSDDSGTAGKRKRTVKNPSALSREKDKCLGLLLGTIIDTLSILGAQFELSGVGLQSVGLVCSSQA